MKLGEAKTAVLGLSDVAFAVTDTSPTSLSCWPATQRSAPSKQAEYPAAKSCSGFVPLEFYCV